ncbi:hypothetical protein ACQ4PT_005796 [Festuca glaucescens]
MKLTCLAAPGSGGSYHTPASHLLEMEGLRLLLDCPVDLSALAAFAPLPLGADFGDAGDLICAVPYYWSLAAAVAAKEGGVDAVLVSSATGMLGLPFLTRLPSFANTKVYVTEVAARIGKLMMVELVQLHSEFVRYYGPDMDGTPKWMEGEKLSKLLSLLQKTGIKDEGNDLSPLMPLYSAVNIEECMQKTQPIKYGQEVCFNGMLMLKASSSGLELGNCAWSLKGPRASITYLPSTAFVSAHALDCDYNSLKENDVILFSDFSSLNVMDEDNENLGENAMLCDDSVSRDDGVGEDENVQILCKKDDIADEIERISFICSSIIDAIKSGGSVLVPIGRLGVILLILELISETVHSFDRKVPIFMISGATEKMIAFTNAVPEWLCKPRQERLFSGEALFGHVELLKEDKLSMFPHLYSKALLAAWKEPCIVFCPDWSLRHSTVVHLLRRWHADKRNLLVLEQGVDAELALKPFMPAAIQVLECSFLSGIKAGKINPLLAVLKPKIVLFPEEMKSRCPIKEDAPWSFLYYSKGKTIEVPNTREEFEVRLAANVALGLQPRQLDGSIAVARLRPKLHLSNGQYMLVAPKDRYDDQSKWQLLHWGPVGADRVLLALQEKGIACAFGTDDDGSAGCERSILVTSPGDALVKMTSERTVICCDDENVSKQIYDAIVDGDWNGIFEMQNQLGSFRRYRIAFGLDEEVAPGGGLAANIEECMQKIQPIKYGQEVCFNGMLMLKASSSGLELGNCAWSLEGPRASITYLPSAVFVSAHALDCDYNLLKENNAILFSDFSSLNVMDEDDENLGENAMLCDDSVSRDDGIGEDENVQILCNNDDIAEEIERISFISPLNVSTKGSTPHKQQLMLYFTVQFPEEMKLRCPLKEDAPWSCLYYSKGKTIEVLNTREEFEVRLAANVALGLQPRQLDGTVAVARSRAKLHLSNGQYMLVAPKDQSDDQTKRLLLHWGAVDACRVLSALQEKGASCSFSGDDDGLVGSERSILVTSPGDALVKITSERTVIYCDDEGTSKQIYDALSSVCNGI